MLKNKVIKLNSKIKDNRPVFNSLIEHNSISSFSLSKKVCILRAQKMTGQYYYYLPFMNDFINDNADNIIAPITNYDGSAAIYYKITERNADKKGAIDVVLVNEGGQTMAEWSTDDDYYAPEWSPDGSYIYFCNKNDESETKIVDQSLNQIGNIISKKTVMGPIMSLDGNLVALHFEDDQKNIELYNPKGDLVKKINFQTPVCTSMFGRNCLVVQGGNNSLQDVWHTGGDPSLQDIWIINLETWQKTHFRLPEPCILTVSKDNRLYSVSIYDYKKLWIHDNNGQLLHHIELPLTWDQTYTDLFEGKIAFLHSDSESSPTLQVFNRDFGNYELQQLPGKPCQAIKIPDSQYIVFQSYEDPEVYWLADKDGNIYE